MGLMPPPTYNSGWQRVANGATCRHCGAPIYSRHIERPTSDSTDGHRLLWRHGDEGGPILEISFDHSRGEFVFSDMDLDHCNRSDGEWERAWEAKIHAADTARVGV